MVVVLPADNAGLLLFGIFGVHLSNYNSLKSPTFIFLSRIEMMEGEGGAICDINRLGIGK